MRLVVGSDHGGFRLKAELLPLLRERAGLTAVDLGTHGDESVDYPDFAHAVAREILEGRADRGLLVCGTGVGMSIAANRHKGIRAVCCSDVYSARLSRQHNDANVLCIGERVLGRGLAWEIVAAWLDEPASPDARHVRRVGKIEI